MTDKRTTIGKSLNAIHKGIEDVFAQQLTAVYDEVQKQNDVKIEHLTEINESQRSTIAKLQQELHAVSDSQKSYLLEIESLKKRGSLFEFISKGLYQRLSYLRNKINQLSFSSEEVDTILLRELQKLYDSIKQSMELFGMEFFQSKEGDAIDYQVHEPMKLVPTDIKRQNDRIQCSVMPGIKFSSGEIIKEKVDVYNYVSPTTTERENQKIYFAYSLDGSMSVPLLEINRGEFYKDIRSDGRICILYSYDKYNFNPLTKEINLLSCLREKCISSCDVIRITVNCSNNLVDVQITVLPQNKRLFAETYDFSSK